MKTIQCLRCKKKFKPKPNAHNIKYCSLRCRGKVYYQRRGGADAQREYYQKFRENNGLPKIKCQICGKNFRQVGSHVVQRHGMTAREYREEFGFDVKRGQLPDDFRELKAEQAIEYGGVKNLKVGKRFWFKKGQKGVGKYKRSQQTIERLKHQFDNWHEKKQTKTNRENREKKSTSGGNA